MTAFEDEDGELDPPEDLPKDEAIASWDWEKQQDREMRIAGILAKAAEDAGLIQPTDDFSWEWHTEFDAEIEAAQQAPAQENVASSNGEAQGECSSGPGSEVHADFGSDLGSGTGGDLGGGFGGTLGGDFGAF